jgi:hypothetical protein
MCTKTNVSCSDPVALVVSFPEQFSTRRLVQKWQCYVYVTTGYLQASIHREVRDFFACTADGAVARGCNTVLKHVNSFKIHYQTPQSVEEWLSYRSRHEVLHVGATPTRNTFSATVTSSLHHLKRVQLRMKALTYT